MKIYFLVILTSFFVSCSYNSTSSENLNNDSLNQLTINGEISKISSASLKNNVFQQKSTVHNLNTSSSIYIYTLSEDFKKISIHTQSIKESDNSFSIKISRDLIKNNILFVEFSKSDKSERLEKIESIDLSLNEINTSLNPQSTFISDVLNHEFNTLINTNSSVRIEDLKNIKNNFDVNEYLGVINYFQGFDNYVKFASKKETVESLVPVIIQTKGESNQTQIENELKPVITEVAVSDKQGVKLRCKSNEIIELNNDDNLTFLANLTFKPSNTESAEALGFTEINVTETSSVDKANSSISASIDKFKSVSAATYVSISGAFKAIDIERNIETFCNLKIIAPKLKDIFVNLEAMQNITPSAFPDAKAALTALDEAYNQALKQLENEYKNNNIDLNIKVAAAAFEREVTKLKNLTEQKNIEIKNYNYSN